MSKRRKRGRALRRRYGHFGMADVERSTATLRKMAHDNPAVTAAALGAASGAIAAGMGAGTAALLGAAAGVAVEQTVKR